MSRSRFTLTNVVDVHTTSAVAEDRSAQRAILSEVDGFTITHGQGAWKDPETGAIVTDHSATIRIMSDDLGAIRRAVRAVGFIAATVYGESEVWAVTVQRDAELQIVSGGDFETD